MVACILTTGGVRLKDENKGQIGGSGTAPLRSTPEALQPPPFGFRVLQRNPKVSTNPRSSEDCRFISFHTGYSRFSRSRDFRAYTLFGPY
jgi:hypothetical protein